MNQEFTIYRYLTYDAWNSNECLEFQRPWNLGHYILLVYCMSLFLMLDEGEVGSYSKGLFVRSWIIFGRSLVRVWASKWAWAVAFAFGVMTGWLWIPWSCPFLRFLGLMSIMGPWLMDTMLGMGVYRELEEVLRVRPSNSFVWLGFPPPRVEVFCWLAVLEKVFSTKENVRRRGLSSYAISDLCVLFGKEGKTIDQLFLYCGFAYSFWCSFLGRSGVSWLCPSLLS